MKAKTSFLILALTVTLFAQPADVAFRRMQASKTQTMAALERQARAITEASSREIQTRQSWEAVKEKRLEEMRDMLGLLPWPERSPLNIRITGTLEQPGYTIEKIVFESLPRFYVTGNLYIPKKREGRVPAIVYVCGHAYSPYGSKAKYQRHGISFAKNGYVAFILDAIQLAEPFALHHGVSRQEMYHWYSRAYTPAGVEVWNAMRAIDYLETRPEVDPDRIGMTGRSGGAAMTWFTAAVDPRVKVAVPVMGISTYAANVAEDTQKLHCDCMFVINFCRHDMLHQGALIAPRPLLMAHGRKDRLFPVPGYEDFERKIGALYSAYGAGEKFKNIVVDTAHQDSDFLREQAVRWFDRYLMGVPDRALDMSYVDAPESDLAVFPDGPPADAVNPRIHETFLKTPEFRPGSGLDQWEQRKSRLLKVLKEKVFPGFPDRMNDTEATGVPRLQIGENTDGGFREVVFRSEPEVEIHGLLSKLERTGERLPALLYIASPGDDPQPLGQFLHDRRGEQAVQLVVYPRGIGPFSWEKGFWKSVLRNAMHVGQTVDSLRLWDVLRALEVLRADENVDRNRITIAGAGNSGVLGLYAALLDPGISQVALVNPPSSHTEGPIFLGILRYLDLPEAAALAAPRRVAFYDRMPQAYEKARTVYRFYGKEDYLSETLDLSAFVQGRYEPNFVSGL
ncbi:MAG TPA: acetylxylan esterase [Acidobacteriota bacterium]|nr:acetylxylan esterase [Acidobacteriota bacterium]